MWIKNLLERQQHCPKCFKQSFFFFNETTIKMSFCGKNSCKTPSQRHDKYEGFCECMYQYGEKKVKINIKFASLSVGNWLILIPQL